MSAIGLRDLRLPPAMLKAAMKRAKQEGKTGAEYLYSLVERDVSAGPSFDEILKPIRRGFEESGVGEEELDAIVTAARKAIAKRSTRKPRR